MRAPSPVHCQFLGSARRCIQLVQPSPPAAAAARCRQSSGVLRNEAKATVHACIQACTYMMAAPDELCRPVCQHACLHATSSKALTLFAALKPRNGVSPAADVHYGSDHTKGSLTRAVSISSAPHASQQLHSMVQRVLLFTPSLSCSAVHTACNAACLACCLQCGINCGWLAGCCRL